MSVHEPTSRFGPALTLPRRSCAKSVAFNASRLNLGSTPVHLGGPVQWVNQPMVHLVNRSTGLDQSTPVNHRSTSVNVGQNRSKLAKFGAEVAGKSERNERIATKPRRPLLEPMHVHHMEPCVCILALGGTPNWQNGHRFVAIKSFYAYA
ncbi:hypothetical protein PIB30_035345 [Stylosanthes scabra]|uniref:Uncharacterized protein n=1 Tax=Stylosanthes scabra TaxID=79078 RepID=A0ABU6VD56_9FABA|nr:hypothetical protein [Stylosanthes scabra]